MFSLQLHVSMTSQLGQRVSLIQHLIALAVVKAILKQPGCEVSKSLNPSPFYRITFYTTELILAALSKKRMKYYSKTDKISQKLHGSKSENR